MSTTIEIDWNHNGTWIDETSRTRRVQIHTGFERPLDTVAAVGCCAITLDNSARRFSPGYAGGPLDGKLLPRRQVRISTSGGAVMFRGTIERIVPEAGGISGDEVMIECVDGISLLARQRVGVSYESSKTVTDAITDLVNAAYTPPALDIHDNGDTLENMMGRHGSRKIPPASTPSGRFASPPTGDFLWRAMALPPISRAPISRIPLAAPDLTISGTTAPDEMSDPAGCGQRDQTARR